MAIWYARWGCVTCRANRRIYSYANTGPTYENLSAHVKESVDKAIERHGVPYQSEDPSRASLTSDFDEFVTKFATKPTVGIWAGG